MTLHDEILSLRTPGGYRAIVADPPWTFDDRGSRIAPKYDLLTTRDLEDMPVEKLAAPDSYLFLWVPSALLDVGIGLAKWWGFTLKATTVWIKTGKYSPYPILGMGHHVRNAHEICLICTRGSITSLDRSIPSVRLARRTAHSVKPEIFQDDIERMTPGPYLELFARRQRANWTCYGNEIARDDSGHAEGEDAET